MGGMTPKIATCCYCGTRAALVLGRGRHALTCASCAAPLQQMKALPRAAAPDPKRPAPAAAPGRGKPRKRRKSWGRRMLEEAWDGLGDIFD